MTIRRVTPWMARVRARCRQPGKTGRVTPHDCNTGIVCKPDTQTGEIGTMAKRPTTTTSGTNATATWLAARVKELDADLLADQHNRQAAIEDLKFAAVPGSMWDADVRADREADGRPVMEVNLFPQFINQVTGDIRHNRPRARISPGDSTADVQIARIREGIIADSEYQSNSDYIYVEAATSNVTCGYGAWRVRTRYTEENPFIQEFYDELIDNPFTVVMDRHAKCPIYSDANHGWIIGKMPVDDFKKEYPGKDLPGDSLTPGKGLSYQNWYDSETVTVAEYFVRKKQKRMMCLMSDGSVIAKSDVPAPVEPVAPVPLATSPVPPELSSEQPLAPPNELPATPQTAPVLPPQAPMGSLPVQPAPTVVKERETEFTTIKRYVMTASEILSKNGLEGEDVPGIYIPIILLTGHRVNIEGKTYISGLVRNSKDSAKNINYWVSALAERIALEPKAPWMATPRQIEGFEADYTTSNKKNLPVLFYNPDQTEQGQPLPPPMRQGAGPLPAALFTQLQSSMSMFEATIGMTGTDLGASGPERTGAAVTARQKPGDVRTFSYIDNLARGIAHGAKIKNEMIAELYDTPRDVRLRGLDDTETYLPVNMTVRDAYNAIMAHPERYKGMNTTKLVAAGQRQGWDAKFNDITAGRYAVRVTVGPSYATQRQESSEYMLRLVSALPKQMGLGADLIAKNSGILDADVLAERIKKTLPPGIAKPTPGEDPMPPPPPNPMAMMQMEKVKLEQEKVKLQASKVEVEKLRVVKESQTEMSSVRQEVLSILAELHMHNTPAASDAG
jgi:hypothetical protein